MFNVDKRRTGRERQPVPAGKRLMAKAGKTVRVIAPSIVDLPLNRSQSEEVMVPASVNGRSLADGRP